MLLFKHARVFFSEVPSCEELQGSGNSPRREEVGRRTLGAYGGFLLPFFYRARFQSFLRESTFHLYEVKVESRFSRNGPVNRTRLEKFYSFDEVIPPEDVV